LSEASGTALPRELSKRYARKEGRTVAMLRALDYGHSCVVEADVYSSRSAVAQRPGPYTFPSAGEAIAFMSEALEALAYLGCELAGEL
jgi:hypothetical protein